MTLKLKFILFIWLIIIPTCGIFTYLYYDLQKSEYLHGVDKKLEEAAIMARALMSPDYHDRLLDKDSVSKAQYLEYIDRYNKLCKTLGLQYLWSNLLLNGKVVFTSSTSTSKDVNNGDHALFFDAHSDPKAFDGVRQSKKTHYSTFTNEWGMGRMVLKPYHDKFGRMYVFGASIAIDELNDKFNAILLQSGGIFLTLFVVSTLIAVFASNRIIRPINDIKNVTKDIADGRYGDHYEGQAGSPELEVLSQSINTMSDAIREQHDRLQTLLEQRTDQLMDSEIYISQIIENMAEGVITIDEKACIEQVNTTALELFGYRKEEIMGGNISQIIPDDSAHDHNEYLKAPHFYLTQIENTARELQAMRKDGTVFPVELNISSMRTKAGTKYVGILHDISERVRTKQSLIMAKEEAEKANQAKSEFLSSISHELRTPLNAVLGFCQLLKLDEHKLSKEHQEHINQIYEGGKYLLDLINDVLNLSQIESGNLSMSIEPVRLIELISLCIKLADEMAKRNSITIEFRKHEDCYILADMTRIKQVLFNLVSNAIKYNREHGTVTIDYEQIDNHIRIYIKDTGHGIAVENAEDVFTPFSRLGYEKSATQGTGIGLTIAKQLIEVMGGGIGYSSEVEVGTTFWVDIPLSEEGCDKESVNDAVKKLESVAKMQKRMTVLYVEDNPSNTRLMQTVIDKLPSITLLCETTAEKGLETAQNQLPDLILMDIDLPGMNGLEAMHHLHENSITKKIPVMAVSAAANHKEIETALAGGFVKYITKPFNIPELINTLRDYQS